MHNQHEQNCAFCLSISIAYKDNPVCLIKWLVLGVVNTSIDPSQSTLDYLQSMAKLPISHCQCTCLHPLMPRCLNLSCHCRKSFLLAPAFFFSLPQCLWILIPKSGIKSGLLEWNYGVLTTGPLENSLSSLVLKSLRLGECSYSSYCENSHLEF